MEDPCAAWTASKCSQCGDPACCLRREAGYLDLDTLKALVVRLPSTREVCLEGMAAVCADRWAFAGHNESVRMSLRTALGAFENEVQGMLTRQHMPIRIASDWSDACTRWAENQTGKGEPVSGRHVFCFTVGSLRTARAVQRLQQDLKAAGCKLTLPLAEETSGLSAGGAAVVPHCGCTTQ